MLSEHPSNNPQSFQLPRPSTDPPIHHEHHEQQRSSGCLHCASMPAGVPAPELRVSHADEGRDQVKSPRSGGLSLPRIRHSDRASQHVPSCVFQSRTHAHSAQWGAGHHHRHHPQAEPCLDQVTRRRAVEPRELPSVVAVKLPVATASARSCLLVSFGDYSHCHTEREGVSVIVWMLWQPSAAIKQADPCGCHTRLRPLHQARAVAADTCKLHGCTGSRVGEGRGGGCARAARGNLCRERPLPIGTPLRVGAPIQLASKVRR